MKWQFKDQTEPELKASLQQWVQAPAVKKALPRALLFLEGEMGAGKSTWVRALLSILSPEQISHGSPTFPIVHEYRLNGTISTLHHIDVYRLKNESEIHDSGIDAILNAREGIVCVEWSSMFADYFAGWEKIRPVFRVTITPGSDESRRDFTLTSA